MFDLCVSIFANDFDFCIEIVKKYDFVELRLDEGKLNNSQISNIISNGKKIIATCRTGLISDDKRFEILLSAVNNGISYIDIEHDFRTDLKQILIDTAKINNCKIINSYHNFNLTPDYSELIRISKLLDNGCDIIKVACKVNTRNDLLNLLSLYKEYEPGKLISLGLGTSGKITRLASLFMGAPFTYASAGKSLETSEGQFEYFEFEKIINLLNNKIVSQ